MNTGLWSHPAVVATRDDFAGRLLGIEARAGASFSLQLSSGSSGGRILQVPRTAADIADIFRRVASPFARAVGRLPRRIAFVGGASHESAATTLSYGDIETASFRICQVADIVAFEPDVLATYPNVLREFLDMDRATFPSLLGVKLGGEPVLDADLRRAYAWDPALLVVEQFGSTEMPAVSVGLHRGGVRSPLELQHDRYTYHLTRPADADVWQPLVVEDRFADLLVRLDRPYDTGDEVRCSDRGIVAVRRAGRDLSGWVAAQEQLLAEGCTNVQFDLGSGVLRYCGPRTDLPQRRRINGVDLSTERGPMRRLPNNKLPLVC